MFFGVNRIVRGKADDRTGRVRAEIKCATGQVLVGVSFFGPTPVDPFLTWHYAEQLYAPHDDR